MQRSLFIGRWQPFHDGHKALINTRLKKGDRVIVGIRDTVLDAQNPYTAYERAAMIQQWCPDIEIVIFPDFDCLYYGRNVGYGIHELVVPEVAGVSGTAIRNHRRIVWLTGNSGAGKTTIAKLLAPRIRAVILDGDEMRDSISLGAGFSLEDRLEHNLRVARLARELVKQTNVVVSVIAPTKAIRAAIMQIVQPEWVYLKRTLEWGDSRPYQPPVRPFQYLEVNNDMLTPEESVEIILQEMFSWI